MRQHQGDIWSAAQPGYWVCVTTNGIVKANGELVMGKGIALEAAQRYPKLKQIAGTLVESNGLRVEILPLINIILFPTKNHYRDKSDINLILRSTIQLLEASQKLTGNILLPRPGCGSGWLKWSEVKPLLEKYLTSDRFIIYSKPGEK